jgi:hypothetical protein
MALLLLNNQTKGLTLISDKHPEAENRQHEELIHTGTRRECLTALDNYWYENNIPEELQIFQEIK